MYEGDRNILSMLEWDKTYVTELYCSDKNMHFLIYSVQCTVYNHKDTIASQYGVRKSELSV